MAVSIHRRRGWWGEPPFLPGGDVPRPGGGLPGGDGGVDRGGDPVRQADLFNFAEGRDPRSRVFSDVDEDLGGVSPPMGGRRCARCGHPLGRGGLWASGWGLLCWNCFQDKGLGRRDRRGDLSSDAAGDRIRGAGSCRGKAYKRRGQRITSEI